MLYQSIHPSIYVSIYLPAEVDMVVVVWRLPVKTRATRVLVYVCGVMQGDSGGPYACKDQQDGWTLIGVNSYVFLRCEQTFVARVTSYVDWIRQTMASYP